MFANKDTRNSSTDKILNSWPFKLIALSILFYSVFNFSNILITKTFYTYVVSTQNTIIENINNSSLLAIKSQIYNAIIFELLFIFLIVMSLNLSSKDAVSTEWDLEWLITLPIKSSQIMFVRIWERTIANLVGWITFFPFLTVFSWKLHYGYFSIIIGLACSLFLQFIEATLRTIIETSSRLKFSASTLRNIQSTMIIASTLLSIMLATISMNQGSFIFNWSQIANLSILPLFPMKLVNDFITFNNINNKIITLIIMSFESIVVCFLATKILMHLLKHGVYTNGTQDRVKNKKNKPQTQTMLLSFLTPIQKKEILLLLRDRRFLTKTFMVPAILLVTQFLSYNSSKQYDLVFHNITAVSIFAFVIAAYAFMTTLSDVLNSEGKSIWVLYTYPYKIEKIVFEKMLFWFVVTLIYPIGIYIYSYYKNYIQLDMIFLIHLFKVLIGLLIFAVIATSIGIFSYDPLSEMPKGLVTFVSTYVYLILAVCYSAAIYLNSWPIICAICCSLTLIAILLMLNAKNKIRHLLDPTT